MQHKQLFLLLIAATVTGTAIVLMDNTTVIGAMAGAFLGVASAYTALDLRAIVKSTGSLPAGKYQHADVWKYTSTMFVMSVLFVLTIVRQDISDINLELTLGFLGPGIIGIIGIIISGMKANKAAMIREPGVSR